MLIVCTDLTTFQTYALATWPDPQRPGHWLAPWETDSVSVIDGNAAIVRTLVEDLPTGLPDYIHVYATLADAMAAYPALPWHRLPVFGGETPEPELVAACAAESARQAAAYAATTTTTP